MKPAELSRQLRQGTGNYLAQRRAVTALSLTAIGSLGLVGLYQMGVIRHLPEPPIPGLDADTVDAAEEAYAILATPDGILGVGSYAATLMLAAACGQDRVTKQPLIPLALAGKVAIDALMAGKLTVDQWTKHRAFCFWCLLAAGSTFASVPFVIPEARAAWRTLTESS